MNLDRTAQCQLTLFEMSPIDDAELMGGGGFYTQTDTTIFGSEVGCYPLSFEENHW